MLSANDFSKKQILLVFQNQGEKLSFSNDNLTVRDKEGRIKFQCTCYRLFLVLVVGNGSITNGLLQRSKKFGFSIVVMSQNLRIIQGLGFRLEGNTKLRKAQYEYRGLDIARHIIENKIRNQRKAIMAIRGKSEYQYEAVTALDVFAEKIQQAETIHEIMGIEGNASRIYFPNFFDNYPWKRREPRMKRDMVNCVLDIGYTILFSFIEAVLNCYGFDLYCGVLHTEFYMRKSLVCDIMEPFRILIDEQVKKAVNLRQCREDDFLVEKGRYSLKWEKNSEYVSWLTRPLVENKSTIHAYIQSYYRAFMKHKPGNEYPNYEWG